MPYNTSDLLSLRWVKKQLPRLSLIRVGKVSALLYSLHRPIIAPSEPAQLLRSYVNGLVNQSLPRMLWYLSRSPGLKAEQWTKRLSQRDDSQIAVWWIWNESHLPLKGSFAYYQNMQNRRESTCISVWSTWCARLMQFDEKINKAFSRWLPVSEY